MGRISSNVIRCKKCRMHMDLCVCDQMPRLKLATRVALVIHRREFVKVSATGPLALNCLENSELLIHGHRDNQIDLNILRDKKRRLFFLYPGGGATVLSRELVQSDTRPVTLIVPDGNWNQAARMGKRLKGVEHALKVTLPKGQVTKWGIRKESHKEGLATFEAVARALGIIEGAEIQRKLEDFFSITVERIHRRRGSYKKMYPKRYE
jgi:DTW domain-containing protein YfiP